MASRSTRYASACVDDQPTNSHSLSISCNQTPPDAQSQSDSAEVGGVSGGQDLELHLLEHPDFESDQERFLDLEDQPSALHQSPTRWRRRASCLRSLVFGWARRRRHSPDDRPNACFPYFSKPVRRRSPLRCIVLILTCSLMILGVFQLLTITFGALAAFFPDEIGSIIDSWGSPGQPSRGLSHWPTDFTGDIHPVACHSHNDYWRKVPLYDAIDAGCISVEADVWLYNDELYVGHSTYALTKNRTLHSLYLNPLLDILEKQNPTTQFYPPDPNSPPNGVFDTAPYQTLVLLIDFKTQGDLLWPVVSSQLEPLRERGYLTHFNGTAVIEGPLTVVGSGNTPFDLLTSNTTYRDIFFDAPLGRMGDLAASLTQSIARSAETTPNTNQGQGHPGNAPTNVSLYSPANSYYASVSFSHSVGRLFPLRSRLTAPQLALIRSQMAGAHNQGLKVRYWGIPSWPIGLRNHIWHVLWREGADVLSVDDLHAATTQDWRRRRGGRGGEGKWN